MCLSTAARMDTQQDTDQAAGVVPQRHRHQPNGMCPARVGTPGSLSTAAKQPISLCPYS